MINGYINFKDLFGFCEDYNRIIINCNHQLIINRTSTDLNIFKLLDFYNIYETDKTKLVKLREVKVKKKKIRLL